MSQETTQKKRVVIVGATGLQGGSVARILSQSQDRYAIRGLTRNTSSSKAQDLTKLGVEVQQSDLDDPKSLEAAFHDANVIFAMTDFWAHLLIWADLPDANKISGGHYPHVYHWQSKAAVTKYIQEEKPELWKKTTTVLFPNYFENCLTQPGTYLPTKQADGTYRRSFVLPETTLLPNVAIADTGKLVQYILDHPDKCLEKTIAFYSEAITEGEKIRSMASTYNIDIRYNEMSADEFQSILKKYMTDINALDFTEQLLIFRDFGMIYGRSEFVQANQLPGLKLKTWREFLAENDLHSRMTSA